MATLSVQSMVDAGTAPNPVAVGATDRADVGNGTNTFLHYTNSSGTAVAVTIHGAGTTSYGVAKPSNVLTLAATTGELWVPLRKEYDQGDGLGAQITTDSQPAGAKVALVRLA